MKRIILAAIAMLAFAFYSTSSQAAVTSFTVTGVTLSKSTGAITLTGTIVCTAGDMFSVFSNVVQTSGGRSGLTQGSLFDTCSGGVDTWVSHQMLEFGSLKNGNALVFASGIDPSDSTGAQQIFRQSVTAVP